MRPILLFTDFGCFGPYTGQMEWVIRQISPQVPIINLLNNAPAANPRLSAYLLAALRFSFPAKSIFLSVVDPGVGSARKGLVLKADEQYFVGPDNGLLNAVAAQSDHVQWWQIVWQPNDCSSSFHGRDIFAPVAARLSLNQADELIEPIIKPDEAAFFEDSAELIYFDNYGNAMTGLRYQSVYRDRVLHISGKDIYPANTFSDVKQGECFWYKNSSGLVEIAINKGSAQQQLKLKLGDKIDWKKKL